MNILPREVMTRAVSDETLHGRMSFLCGPRQIGKTTAVTRFLETLGQGRHYYNWDTPTVKKRHAADPAFFVEDLPPELSNPWVVLDEIHKYPNWKNILKGYYDEWHTKVRFIVTGSARLDLFRRSGDSLVGRYFLFRMLPLGPREAAGNLSPRTIWSPEEELKSIPMADAQIGQATEQLLSLTGFPEPYSVGTQEFCTRWRDNYVSLVLREDLRDLTRIVQIGKLETLMYLLPDRIGTPLSLNAFCKMLEVNHASVRAWLEAMKMVYLIFSLSPWMGNLSRSVRKETKCYFWDWGMVEAPGSRFENFIAVQLQRVLCAWNEKGKGPYALYYLRTKDGREVDFAIVHRKKVVLLIEAKLSEEALDSNLPFFQRQFQVPLAIQVVRKAGTCLQKGKGLYVMGADRLFTILP